MKCAYYHKNEDTVSEKDIQRYAMEFFSKKMSDANIRNYIMQNSWDEEDYKKKLQHYRETGELPEKLF